MCGRFTLTGTDRRQLEIRFGASIPETLGGVLGRFNAAPGQEILMIGSPGEGGRFSDTARWGLVPGWAPDLKTGYRMINARSETVQTSRAYGPLVKSAANRCLIPADGFFEWTGPSEPGGPKQPVRFTVDDGVPFAMAGLWTERDWEGGRLASCTIITTDANAEVAPVHDRMPVILVDEEAEAAWIEGALSAGDLDSLLVPLDPGRVTSRMASTRLNRVGAAAEGPDLLEED